MKKRMAHSQFSSDSIARSLGNSCIKTFHKACRFQRICQAETINADLAFICMRKHHSFRLGQVPEGSTKPWVLLKLAASTPDISQAPRTKCTPPARTRHLWDRMELGLF